MTWPEDPSRPAVLDPSRVLKVVETMADGIRLLSPQNDLQRALQARAVDLSENLLEARWAALVGVGHHWRLVLQPVLREPTQLGAQMGRALRFEQLKVVPVHGQDEIANLEITHRDGPRPLPGQVVAAACGVLHRTRVGR